MYARCDMAHAIVAQLSRRAEFSMSHLVGAGNQRVETGPVWTTGVTVYAVGFNGASCLDSQNRGYFYSGLFLL